MIRIPIVVGGIKALFEGHDAFHLDEGVGYWLIKKFGNQEFLRKYARDGVIKVGVGGGPLDEHPNPADRRERKEGECAATLVAKALRVDQDPGLKNILRFTRERDLNAGGQPFDLASLANLMSLRYPENPEKLINWIGVILEEKYQQDRHFQKVTGPEFKRVAEVEFVRAGREVVKMATIVSDDDQINKFARSSEGPGAAIVIQKRLSGKLAGNVQIYTALKFKIKLDDVARMINLAEQEIGGRPKITNWRILAAEGTIPGGKWHFFPKGRMLLNGSSRFPEVEATKLPLEWIKRIVRIGINPRLLPRYCPTTHCLVSRPELFRRCDWYRWGLQRCQEIRQRQRQRWR